MQLNFEFGRFDITFCYLKAIQVAAVRVFSMLCFISSRTEIESVENANFLADSMQVRTFKFEIKFFTSVSLFFYLRFLKQSFICILFIVTAFSFQNNRLCVAICCILDEKESQDNCLIIEVFKLLNSVACYQVCLSTDLIPLCSRTSALVVLYKKLKRN